MSGQIRMSPDPAIPPPLQIGFVFAPLVPARLSHKSVPEPMLASPVSPPNWLCSARLPPCPYRPPTAHSSVSPARMSLRGAQRRSNLNAPNWLCFCADKVSRPVPQVFSSAIVSIKCCLGKLGSFCRIRPVRSNAVRRFSRPPSAEDGIMGKNRQSADRSVASEARRPPLDADWHLAAHSQPRLLPFTIGRS
jgi:hypothetical protein